jgi:FixJ family two-component response regulator
MGSPLNAPPPNPGRRASDRAQQIAAARLSVLTRREREVLEELVAGGQNKAIARSLSLSPRTVEAFRKKIMNRLGVSSLAEMIVLALRAGLLPDLD